MNEIIFVVEESPDGGFEAKALSAPIFTQADTLDELRMMIRDAVACHFDEADRPQIIRLHFVRDEVIAMWYAMPHIPRDISGIELAKALGRYGYQITRQTGSHLRLTRIADGKEQRVTIARHHALRIGTLNGILATVASHMATTKVALVHELFG